MKNLIRKILKEDDEWDWVREADTHPFSDIIDLTGIKPTPNVPTNAFKVVAEFYQNQGDDSFIDFLWGVDMMEGDCKFRGVMEFYKKGMKTNPDDLYDLQTEMLGKYPCLVEHYGEDLMWEVWAHDNYYDQPCSLSRVIITYYDDNGTMYHAKLK
jgi:hypothetical protein